MEECKDFVIWQDMPVPIINKETHVRKIGGKTYRSFIKTFGDIPIVRINLITNKWEPVVNYRGKAYAARKRLKYRKKKKVLCIKNI